MQIADARLLKLVTADRGTQHLGGRTHIQAYGLTRDELNKRDSIEEPVLPNNVEEEVLVKGCCCCCWWCVARRLAVIGLMLRRNAGLNT